MFSIVNLKDLQQLYSQSPYARYQCLIQKFKQKYQVEPNFIARAPGRVNIIGEHIDYEGYGVLPAAIEKDCLIAVLTTNIKQIQINHLNSQLYPSTVITNDPQAKINFVDNYIKYFWAGYRSSVKNVSSESLVGMKIVIEGNIPVAAGLSSSSALCVCSALAALYANNQNGKIPKQTVIQNCISGERQVGTASGGMDQSISIMGKVDFCLYIQFNPITCTEVNLPKGCKFVVMNSLVQSAKLNTAVFRYNKRVCQCRLSVWILAKKLEIPQLKELKILKQIQGWLKLPLHTLGSLVETYIQKQDYTIQKIEQILVDYKVADILSDIPLYKEVIEANKYFRLYEAAKHVFDQAYRVINFIQICKSNLNQKDKKIMLGKLMNESQFSCKNLYDCSSEQIDQITTLARQKGAYGSRLTGAGWGGCTVSLVDETESQNFISKMKEQYFQKKENIQKIIQDVGIDNVIFESRPSQGACIINL